MDTMDRDRAIGARAGDANSRPSRENNLAVPVSTGGPARQSFHGRVLCRGDTLVTLLPHKAAPSGSIRPDDLLLISDGVHAACRDGAAFVALDGQLRHSHPTASLIALPGLARSALLAGLAANLCFSI
jgi:hypothetical protein